MTNGATVTAASNNTPNRGYLTLEEIRAIVASARLHGVRVAALRTLPTTEPCTAPRWPV
ncbi:MAG: hypothetical protein R2882_02335 [Gemmatimonadales bacterium]